MKRAKFQIGFRLQTQVQHEELLSYHINGRFRMLGQILSNQRKSKHWVTDNTSLPAATPW